MSGKLCVKGDRGNIGWILNGVNYMTLPVKYLK